MKSRWTSPALSRNGKANVIQAATANDVAKSEDPFVRMLETTFVEKGGQAL